MRAGMVSQKQTIEVGISKLSVLCIVGCMDHERTQEQAIEIDVRYVIHCPEHDQIQETVDYVQVQTCIETLVQHGKFHLLETIAMQVAKKLLQAFSRMEKVWVCIHKRAAVVSAASAFVTYEEERS
jgi:dihydroneopterin aldolase